MSYNFYSHPKAFILGIAVILTILSSCGFQNTSPSQFPDANIIFQNNTLKGGHSNETLGFVNEDGSGLTYLSVLVPNRWGGKSSPSYPVISRDGSTIIFRIPSAPGSAGELVIMHSGQHAIICNVEMGGGRPQITSDQKHILIHLVSPGGRLALLQIAACEVGIETQTSTIFDDDTLQHSPREGSLSPDNKALAFTEWRDRGDSGETPSLPTIYVRDLVNEHEVLIGDGFAPIWSPDGRWLAYTGAAGIYLARADGTGTMRIVKYQSPEGGGRPSFEEDWPPLPAWSPDGLWLVYHKCILETSLQTHCRAIGDYAIFKVNVETGEEIKILDGGLNPYWRWQ